MTTKQELQDKIAELQAKVDSMPDDKRKACFMATDGKEEKYGVIQLGSSGGTYASTSSCNKDKKGPAINPDATQAYADAFEVLIECRARSDWDGDEKVWAITDCGGRLNAYWSSFRNEPSGIFGQYKSQESAKAAIKAIGKDRLIQAYNILVKGEW